MGLPAAPPPEKRRPPRHGVEGYRRDSHIFGPDRKTAFFGAGLFTALSAIFCFLLSHAAPPGFSAIAGMLWAFVFGAWLLAATTSPGIVPVSQQMSAEDAAHCAQVTREGSGITPSG
ncbi:hypothetical protein T492DRAFT_873883 [Pavlovales sp. CCMP2436]|nr:hypothetical protein T492DRAFT_873883 [Pavlovales sp. CCMP2436]